jgi:uncharacterized membrane protein
MGFLKKTNIAILTLGIIGIIDAGYLSLAKMSNTTVVCAPGLGDCGSVNNSAYSELYGIPVAYLGLLSYLAISVLVLMILNRQSELTWNNYLIFGITLVGLLFSGYLTYIELAILHAVCFYCVVSAVLMLGLFVLSLYKIFKLLNN